MIAQQMHDDGMFPRVFCDACHKPIDVAETGIVLWDDQGQITFAHIGVCSRAFHAIPYSWPLAAFFVNLLRNTKITAKELKAEEEGGINAVLGATVSRTKVDKTA
ncbi:MAG: hypothetical protein ABSA54_17495 [Terriglobales bacterium]|jgi:hypothetical protein